MVLKILMAFKRGINFFSVDIHLRFKNLITNAYVLMQSYNRRNCLNFMDMGHYNSFSITELEILTCTNTLDLGIHQTTVFFGL